MEPRWVNWHALHLADAFRITDFDVGCMVSVSIEPISDEIGKREFDGFNCGSIDLGVVHKQFRGNLRLLELVDDLIAKRFDPPTRFFAARYGKVRQLIKAPEDGPMEAVNATERVLVLERCHSIIPGAVWKAKRLAWQKTLAERKLRELEETPAAA